MIHTRLVKETDLYYLATIYYDLYNDCTIKEGWSVEKSYKLLLFFYTIQPDLFIVAEKDSNIVGAVASLVKPWADGNRLVETEIFVAKDHQHNGIASRLFMDHFSLALNLYNVNTIEACTYQEEDGFPLKWFKNQGYSIVNYLYIINGNIQKTYDYFKNAIKHNNDF